MKAPESVQERATELGFEIVGWDESGGAIRGLPTSPYGGETMIGSHDEVRAYLQGFASCRRFELQEIERAKIAEEPTLRRSLLVLRGKYVPIPGDASINVVSARPYVPFRGDRVAIPDSVAGLYDVLDVLVGNRSQLHRSGEMSGEMFATRIRHQARFEVLHDGMVNKLVLAEGPEAEFGRALSMETCQASTDVSIHYRRRPDVIDPRSAGMTFEAMILGRISG